MYSPQNRDFYIVAGSNAYFPILSNCHDSEGGILENKTNFHRARLLKDRNSGCRFCLAGRKVKGRTGQPVMVTSPSLPPEKPWAYPEPTGEIPRLSQS